MGKYLVARIWVITLFIYSVPVLRASSRYKKKRIRNVVTQLKRWLRTGFLSREFVRITGNESRYFLDFGGVRGWRESKL